MSRSSQEMPNYEIESYIDPSVQIRKYSTSKWLSTDADCNLINRSNLRSLMFGKLFKYLSGQNSFRESIEMTVPVLTNYSPTSNTNVSMCMSFYLPKRYHTNTPLPLNDAFIRTVPEQVYACIRFNDANPSFNDYLNYKNLLVHRLGHLAGNFDCVSFITAGYNAPFDTSQTHEIWLRKIHQ